MQNEYPEHIDQLDNFYQQHFAELEILPPADMWDRISASYAEGKVDKEKAGFLYNNKNKLIGIVAVTLFISASTYFYVNHSNKPTPDQNGTPFLEKENVQDSVSLYQNENKKLGDRPSVKKDKANKSKLDNTTTSSSVENNSSTNNNQYADETTEPTTEMIVNEPALEQKEEIQPEVIQEKAPKKKVSFKDKHKKEYQDSTRNLFVPGK